MLVQEKRRPSKRKRPGKVPVLLRPTIPSLRTLSSSSSSSSSCATHKKLTPKQLISAYHASLRQSSSPTTTTVKHDGHIQAADQRSRSDDEDSESEPSSVSTASPIMSLAAYQQLSSRGEKRGSSHQFNTAKWVMERLLAKHPWVTLFSHLRSSKRNRHKSLNKHSYSTVSPDNDSVTPSPGTQRRIRLLDVGALSNHYLPYTAIVDSLPIDLHPQHPSVHAIDFFQLPFTQLANTFDAVVLSLVLNFVPTSSLRGDMLRLTAMLLHPPLLGTSFSSSFSNTMSAASLNPTLRSSSSASISHHDSSASGSTEPSVPSSIPYPSLSHPSSLPTGVPSIAYSYLYLILPRACIDHSRYMDQSSLTHLLSLLSFTVTDIYRSNKLILIEARKETDKGKKREEGEEEEKGRDRDAKRKDKKNGVEHKSTLKTIKKRVGEEEKERKEDSGRIRDGKRRKIKGGEIIATAEEKDNKGEGPSESEERESKGSEIRWRGGAGSDWWRVQ